MSFLLRLSVSIRSFYTDCSTFYQSCILFISIITKILIIRSSASNRIIHAKDHASIQIALADVDTSTGRMTDTYKMYAICGAIRRMVSFNQTFYIYNVQA